MYTQDNETDVLSLSLSERHCFQLIIMLIIHKIKDLKLFVHKPFIFPAHASLGSQGHRKKPVPDIYAGVHKEEEKKQQKIQQATYRRLFMDIEREQVKENIRRKEHSKRIQK